MAPPRYEAVVIGLSAGGMEVLKQVVPALMPAFPMPVAITQHIGGESDGFLAEYLNKISPITVKEAEDKEPMRAAHVYIAPAGYHLLIEGDRTLSLSADPRVQYSCPSIDVLFESAADVFGASLIGVVMTGTNKDGSHGLKTIKAHGGCAIVQNPATAQAPLMPKACMAATPVDHVIEPAQLAPLLMELSSLEKGERHAIARLR